MIRQGLSQILQMASKSTEKVWAPPAVITELYAATAGNKFASINRPTAGARNNEELEKGDAPYQLYSLTTPNGQKVGILFEELGLEYDAHTINIGAGAQFSKGFVAVNPNSKIPCAVDFSEGEPVNLFESGAIMQYLAEKHNKFIPKDPRDRVRCLTWMNWAQVQAFVTGNFGHFMVYAPDGEIGARNYGVSRYGMEVQRLCSVLDQHLAANKFMCGEEYTIADMACFTWFNMLHNKWYDHKSGVKCADFLNMSQYKNANKWADSIRGRPEVQRGLLVCSPSHPKPWLNPDNEKYHHLRGQQSKF